MRIAMHVIGMFVLGAAALMCPGLLYQQRLDAPFPVSTGADAGGPIGTSGHSQTPALTSGARQILEGIRADLTFFSRHSDSDRSAALAALDGAYRVSDVLRFAAPDNDRASALFAGIKQTRTAVQDGDIASARQRAIALRTDGIAISNVTVIDPAAYIDAVVLAPTGRVLGSVTDAHAESLIMEPGAGRLLGVFPTTHEPQKRLSMSTLVFGERRRLGMTMVIATD